MRIFQRLANLLHFLPNFVKEGSAILAVLDEPKPFGQHAGDGHEFPVGFGPTGIVETWPFGLAVTVSISISIADHHIFYQYP